jgi:hypothetical protein
MTLRPIRQAAKTISLSLLAAALAILTTAPSGQANSGPAADKGGDPWQICAQHADRVQAERDLPPYLLHAIAKVESGRWNRQEEAVFAWPWTVTAEGKGRFLPDKAAAIAEVRALQARGLSNIDVGCMQVNLRHHPNAFASLEDAFDPSRNFDYAAGFLHRLRQDARSWTRAIGLYHSATPVYHGRYRVKVFRAWREERHRANRERLAKLAAQAQ